MNRISERLEAVMTTVKCPGCGKTVVPILIAAPKEDQEAPGAPGGRWSFVWRPPSGRVCPECDFPLERYARRAKWIRVFSFGVVTLTITFLLYIAGRVNPLPGWVGTVERVLLGVGLVAFAVGLGGMIVGGRRTDQQVPQ